jgi:phage terminase large subunit-like protein
MARPQVSQFVQTIQLADATERHSGNPMLEWCLGNVVGKADRRGNLYPTKQRPEQKIDAAVALMMALGRAMIEDENARGLGSFLTDLICA